MGAHARNRPQTDVLRESRASSQASDEVCSRTTMVRTHCLFLIAPVRYLSTYLGIMNETTLDTCVYCIVAITVCEEGLDCKHFKLEGYHVIALTSSDRTTCLLLWTLLPTSLFGSHHRVQAAVGINAWRRQRL